MTQSDVVRYMFILNLKNHPFTMEELTLAWKKAARKYHPDVSGGSAKLMQLVNEAYTELKDVVDTVPKVKKSPVKRPVDKKSVKMNNFMRMMQKQTTKTLRKRQAAGDRFAGEALKDWE